MRISMQSLTVLLQEAKRTFIRFPLSLISAFIATGLWLHSIDNPASENLVAIMTSILGISLFTAISLYFERPHGNLVKLKYVGLLLGVISLLAFYFEFKDSGNYHYVFLFIQLAVATHLFFAVSGFLHSKETNGFWQFNRIVFIRILTSFLYAMIIFVGLSIAILAVNYLFGIELHRNVYPKLFVICTLIFQTWHFLAGIPANLSSLEDVKEYPRELKILTQYILISLISLYMVILYLYMIRLCVVGALPKGFVGWMVSILSVAGIFNLLLLHPIRQMAENNWVKTYSKWFYVLILPLLGLLFLGLFRRVGDYGITEARYFLFVLALWLVAIAIYFIFSKTKNIKVIPTSLLIVTLLTAFGPWSAYQVSLRSQSHRFTQILDIYRVNPKDSQSNSKIKISEKDGRELKEIMVYFITSHDLENLKKWNIDKSQFMSEDRADKRVYNDREKAVMALNAMGIIVSEQEVVDEDYQYAYYTSKWQSNIMDVKGYDLAAPFGTTDGESNMVSIGDQALHLTSRALKEVFSIKQFLENLVKEKGFSPRYDVDLKDMTYETENSKAKVKIIFYSIALRKLDKTFKVDSARGLLLIKLK